MPNPIQSVFKSVLLTATVCLSAACSKGTDDYVGYWSHEGASWLTGKNEAKIMEIKKDGSVYLVTENILQQNSSPMPLTERDGKLFLNIGFGDLPFVLSDDGKKLYVHNDAMVKMDTATKDKIVAHK